MLVARRDPPFHGDARDIAPVNLEANPRSKPPRVARFVTVIQMVGSLLAVPVGIGSAYTFYRANFSPETTCQTLRSGIVAMLDKGVDASTRRILVRRDVETFEKTCAAVDPEATAAFKALLAAEKSPPVAAAASASKAQANDSAPKEVVHKAEPKPQATPKPAATNTQAPAVQNVRRDSSESDTQWLDAVRQALVTHQPGSRPVENSKARSTPQPSARPTQRDADPAVPPPLPHQPQQHPHLPRPRRWHPLLRRLCRHRSPSLRHRRKRMWCRRRTTTRFHRNRSPLQTWLSPRKPRPTSPVARGSANGYRRSRCSVPWWITLGTSPVASPPSGSRRFAHRPRLSAWRSALTLAYSDRGHLTFNRKARKKRPRTALACPSRPFRGTPTVHA